MKYKSTCRSRILIYTASEGLLEIRPGQEIEVSESLSYPYLELVKETTVKRGTKKRSAKVDKTERDSTDGEHSSS